MPDETEYLETVKYYTRARRFPQLLGRMPDGTKIPGGPYTVQQLLAAVAIVVGGGMTIDMWGVFGVLGNFALLFGVAFGAVFVIGRLPTNGRNPFFALVGLFRAVNAPSSGRYQGRPIRLRRPRRVRHRTNVFLGPLPGTDPWAGVEPAVEHGPSLAATAVSDGLRNRLTRQPPPDDRALAPSGGQPRPVAAPGPLSGVQALLALLPADGDGAGGRNEQTTNRT